MITLAQYVGKHSESPDWTDERKTNVTLLLARVNKLMFEVQSYVRFPINPLTGSQVGGETMGGFRPQSCPIGAPKSAHKTGEAVDIYDPLNQIDEWIDKHQDILVRYDLYREASVATNHWCHLSTRPPKSGNRTFYP